MSAIRVCAELCIGDMGYGDQSIYEGVLMWQASIQMQQACQALRTEIL